MSYFIFNGLSSKDLGVNVVKINRNIFPEIQDQYEKISGRAGSYLFPQPFGDRKISIDCDLPVLNKDEFMAKFRAVAAWLKTNDKVQLILSDETDKYYMAKVANNMQIQRDFFYLGEFTIEFICDPFAYSLNDITQKYTVQSGATQGIYNNGTAETNPVISIIAAWGDIKNPKITLNDVIFLYNGTITNNSQIDINSETFTCYKGMDRDINTTGGYDPAEDSILALIDGEFPTLQPGPNSLIFNCENGVNADIKIQFKERWI
ncbi:hypothetical protein BVF91_11995 [Thermoanaerobacterium sp. PSU-2]|uniref:distal tail protein Dit n=1 Tax=Thermoanaerobacterium sp. PSU-2 TaxID=1930849 RepID=UPI000A1530FF|nr:distal tail protein Dit [Thermoanaerobacterium sp. PSU-2]ORX22387.1 hypothetical protein BVF91_11995 [Thermoanaerobacterium sp. PSU-2]